MVCVWDGGQGSRGAGQIRESTFSQGKKPCANLSWLLPFVRHLQCCVGNGREGRKRDLRSYFNFLSFAIRSGIKHHFAFMAQGQQNHPIFSQPNGFCFNFLYPVIERWVLVALTCFKFVIKAYSFNKQLFSAKHCARCCWIKDKTWSFSLSCSQSSENERQGQIP